MLHSCYRQAESIIASQPSLEKLLVLSPQEAFAEIEEALGSSPEAAELASDIAHLVDMFCCLFDPKARGIEIFQCLIEPCVRAFMSIVFPVGWLQPIGVLPQNGYRIMWLTENKLGAGNMGKPDALSGLYDNASFDIKQLKSGDVALLKKSELWHDNEGAGLIHRSPQLSNNTHRLLLTIDFVND